ncbi:hypothetical protein B0H14DRAFT_2629955 [Mycena olivaceomarginata]|nr:hypothetical protein B0H14DRAFT_2629955 [Mycena olivaceomarginata]
MSTGSSPAPRIPRKQQTARITTGGRHPPKISSSQYVDDEVEHDSDGSNGEENVNKYESDFIDNTVQEGEPIEWEDSPPRVGDDTEDLDGEATSNTEERPAPDKRAVKKKSVGDSAAPSKRPGVPGIKSNAVCLGTGPGNTQGTLEVVKNSAGPVKVTMDEAEHAFVDSIGVCAVQTDP